MKSLVLAVMGLLCSMSVSAEDFAVDGIYYNITSSTDKTVAVTFRGNDYSSYYDEYSGEVKIPESVTYNGNTYSVTSIGDYAFQSCSSLTSVELPNSVTSIGVSAFRKCSSLTSVVIPNSVTSIGDYAFWGCSSLTSVELPNSVTSIGDTAFYGCKSLTSVEIPNSVTSIGSSAFSGCSNLTSVEIPNSVTSIGEYAFSGTAWYNNQPDGVIYAGKVLYKYKGTMPANTSITIEDGTVSISPFAFYVYEGCSSLTSVVIPNSVTSISDAAFYKCWRLTSVEIPNSVTSIGDAAFYGTAWYNNQPDGVIYAGKVLYKYKGTMPANTSIRIEDGTVSISPYAFECCSSLTSVEIPNSVTSIGSSAFSGCSSLTSVEIPNSVTSIGSSAFQRCSSLTSVEIPNSVTSIGEWAFSYCSSLTSVEIGNSVTSIGNYAFSNCENLKKLISYAEAPPVCLGWSVFYGVNTQECILQVPEKSISAYQQADLWKEFFLIEGVPTAIGGVTVDGAVPATADVYSTNGMLVKRNADLKNLKHELPAGIYIIGGKKVYVR